MLDRRADFGEFVAARRPHLLRFAYFLCGDWHAAEDLVQTALAKAYVAWPKVQRAGAEEAFVRRIIARSVVDESRRPWRRERPGLDGVGDRAAPADDVDARHDVVVALGRLSPMQRRCVVLRHWCGLSVADVADDLRISPGTVKSHTARGLAALQTLLTHELA